MKTHHMFGLLALVLFVLTGSSIFVGDKNAVLYAAAAFGILAIDDLLSFPENRRPMRKLTEIVDARFTMSIYGKLAGNLSVLLMAVYFFDKFF